MAIKCNGGFEPINNKSVGPNTAVVLPDDDNKMHFEWGPKKDATNRRKHDVTFEQTASALRDVFSATARDPDHSEANL